MSQKDLKKERIVYKPFEYPEAADYWLQQLQAQQGLGQYQSALGQGQQAFTQAGLDATYV